MKILAIDTSEKTACVAICEDRRPLAIYTVNSGFTQSETMMPMISAALRDTRLTPDDIDLFACTTGPGSFTGVRIGVSLIKGMALGKSKICIGVSSLESLARNICEKGSVIVPVTDARQGRLYFAAFLCDGKKYERLLPDDACTLGEVIEKIKPFENVIFVGNGREMIETEMKCGAYRGASLSDIPSGYSVAMAALDEYESSTPEERLAYTDMNLRPEYLRPSQAERSLEEKEKNNG